jgi:hypothetical protein
LRMTVFSAACAPQGESMRASAAAAMARRVMILLLGMAIRGRVVRASGSRVRQSPPL